MCLRKGVCLSVSICNDLYHSMAGMMIRVINASGVSFCIHMHVEVDVLCS